GGLAGLAELGVVHRQDPALAADAELRLRAGPGAYCLTGVTHTLASRRILDALAGLLHAPLEPWDAVVCTSRTAREVVEKVQAVQADYLRWRLGPQVAISGPQLPVIPLGMHLADFDGLAERRAAARRRFGFADDEVVVLYVGRLKFH